MQFGHIALACAIATYDWSFANAGFCISMHFLPNVDSLLVKAGLDKPLIKGATRLESLIHRKNHRRDLETAAETDPFWVENGGFHCTVTHSVFFAIAVALFIGLFSLHYAAFALVAILTHYAADIGSTVGLPLLWPLTRKKFTLSLFKDTGWWGKDMLLGYYRQPAPWILEGLVMVFLGYRLWMIY